MSLLDTASLIVTPNGYKEGKLYSVIPSDGSGDMSVTRATTATRVNSAGLVELVPYNLVSSSGDISTQSTYWTSNQSGTSIQNAAIAPDGTTTASQITSAGGQYSGIAQNGISVSAVPYTYSCYLKATSGTPTIRLTLYDGVTFHQTDFTINSEWIRYSFTFTPIAGTFGVVISSSSVNTWLAWGAQLNEGTIRPYQKTETRLNIPRLDYSNGTCPSLLVEPQRTNLLTYSSSFDNAAWIKENASVTANTTTSPDGTLTADKLEEDNTTNKHDFYYGGISTNGVSTTIGQSYTISIYAKAAERNFMQIALGTGQVSGNPRVNFNLLDGTITAIDSGITGTIESAANGFYKCNIVVTAASTFLTFIVQTQISGTAARFATYAGTTGSGLYLWGAQLEAGSYATSYIPTTSASVTRNADEIFKTGISSLIGQTEGTLFFDGIVNDAVNPASNIINTNKQANTISSFNLARNYASNTYQFYYFRGNGTFDTVGLTSTNTYALGQRVKIAIRYKSGDLAMYINGNLEDTSSDTYTTNGTKSELFLNDAVTYFAYQESVSFNAVALWTQPLTNTQLATLTTI
jgi:hypothetical protein